MLILLIFAKSGWVGGRGGQMTFQIPRYIFNHFLNKVDMTCTYVQNIFLV